MCYVPEELKWFILIIRKTLLRNVCVCVLYVLDAPICSLSLSLSRSQFFVVVVVESHMHCLYSFDIASMFVIDAHNTMSFSIGPKCIFLCFYFQWFFSFFLPVPLLLLLFMFGKFFLIWSFVFSFGRSLWSDFFSKFNSLDLEKKRRI